MAALVASWLYGAQAASAGYEQIAFFRGERIDLHDFTDAIPGTQARDAAFAAGQRWITAREGAEKRELPFGVASLLLGGAMVFFAARSMAFREGSRSKLVQIVVVHAAASAAGFLCMQDVGAAETAFKLSLGMGSFVTRGIGDAETIQRTRDMLPAMERAAGPLALVMSIAVSGLIVIALTRPRARAFFHDPEPDALGGG
jgi:hypothetical protein